MFEKKIMVQVSNKFAQIGSDERRIKTGNGHTGEASREEL
jgi:hypothetical protein